MKLTEAIQLDIDEKNDLDFSIRIEGADNSASSVRMVLEAEDVSYMFKGKLTQEANVVKFTLPKMRDLKEGTYSSRVEVVVDNKFFLPVEFDLKFVRPVSVVVEQVQVAKKIEAPKVSVTAMPVVKQKPKVEEVIQPTLKHDIKISSLKQRYEQRKK